MTPGIRRLCVPIAVFALTLAGSVLILQAALAEPRLDRAGERWVTRTLAGLSLDQKVGQLIVSSFQSMYTSSDSATFDTLSELVTRYQVGGFHVFGGTELAPSVLLNPAYGTVTLGDPFAAASLLNRLQGLSGLPLLNTADFEAGAGFRIAGTTAFPRAMAFGATGDESLSYQAGRITAIESRALGIHVNFAPVVDVNNNARNPVINTRSFGQDPAMVGRLASAYVRGLREEGMLATLKHFPGHGDTDVDTHLGLATITHPRDHLESIELPPFRAGIAAGADAVMVGHIELPALDPTQGVPATFSHPIATRLLRDELGFTGLTYTDSLSMDAITEMAEPGLAAVRAVQAGADIVLHSPNDARAVAAIKQAVEAGEITRAQLDASVTRILTAKARLGLHQPASRQVSLDRLPTLVGTRASAAVADEVSQRAVTLLKDTRSQVPLAPKSDMSVLYLSVLDYPSGWRIAAPSRTVIPELKRRWPNVTAIELSDRASRSEIELVRASARRYDVIIAGVFVRTASFSGRMDLVQPITDLLRGLAAETERSGVPFVTVFFGNPYVATFLPELPAMLLTYDFYDRAEASAVRALVGDAPIGGKLPIELPGMFPVGHGLTRTSLAGKANP